MNILMTEVAKSNPLDIYKRGLGMAEHFEAPREVVDNLAIKTVLEVLKKNHINPNKNNVTDNNDN